MDQFSKRIVEEDKFSNDAALMAILSGLRTKTLFWWSVHKDGPATYQEFLTRAEKHISAEEATSDEKNERSDRRDNVKNKEKDLKSEKKESPKKALEFQHLGWLRPIPPRYQGYHVLNTLLENVLMKTKRKDILKKPVPMRVSSSELNQKRYCKYHRSAGHDTYDCRDLKGKIESLIRRGHLKEFLSRPPGGGETPSLKTGLNYHLHLNTGEHVRPFSKYLQGFTRDYVNPNGQIALVVELELSPCHRRIIADFIIVDLPSNYNAILGQPILHELKIAASIYHYAIKFSTLHGVGMVRGSQLVARSCNITFPRVGVDMLLANPELPARRSDMDELDEGTVEDLGCLDPGQTYVNERPNQ
ncbi:Retrotrans gag domain-containing protein [Abeliophyllum distichum]|uniref:Retrotrans gag domain-containing protein n=1 Tax=Abeliophyllum distichum TaxID=126358 RepID=A0ABD1TI80_9LAMI